VAQKLPKEILVYVCDEIDGNVPVYAVASDIDEIPEDSHDTIVGTYTLTRTSVFKVRRELK